MWVIFSASGDRMSFQHSSRLIGPLVRWVFPHLPDDTVHAIVVFVRKCAHLAEYAVLALLLWLLIDCSSYGARLRAAVDNPRMARAVGIDVNLLFTVTFAGGCALAAFGSVIGAALLPLEPYYALRYLVPVLVVVGVGGIGNFKGSFVAAIALGIIDTGGKFLFPQASAYLFYGAVIILLLLRPNGLMPAKSAA